MTTDLGTLTCDAFILVDRLAELEADAWARKLAHGPRAAHLRWLRLSRLLERAQRRLRRRELALDGALFEQQERRIQSAA
jgi:Zn-dependent protease with chaperone function